LEDLAAMKKKAVRRKEFLVFEMKAISGIPEINVQSCGELTTHV
jgi:hypothetical protein